MLRQIAEAVRTRRVAARELITLALDRIDRLDGAINAVVALRAEEALAEAGALDDRVSRGEDPGPLAGLPCLIKDIEDLAGLPTTHGSMLFREAPPAPRDGVSAARLRAAGAIAVGKANTPEFATQGFTANHVFGATRNPWAPDWSPGGSSGGSGAAIAAGLVPVATATDTGGSVRIPAAFCGLLGLKPTSGLVSLDPGMCWPELTTTGPLAVTSDDLRLLLEVEAGGAVGEPGGPPPRRAVAVPRFFDWGPLPEEIDAAFATALEVLERDLGLSVERRKPADVIRSGDPDADWDLITGPGLVSWLGREITEAHLDALFPTTRAFVKRGLATTPEDYRAAIERRAEYRRDLDEALGEDAVIATPTLTVDGWLAEGNLPGSPEPGPPASAYNTAVQNLTGHGAISLPAGLLPNGVPFGVQLTGARGSDATLLDLAAAWERARPWPRAAPGSVPFEPV